MNQSKITKYRHFSYPAWLYFATWPEIPTFFRQFLGRSSAKSLCRACVRTDFNSWRTILNTACGRLSRSFRVFNKLLCLKVRNQLLLIKSNSLYRISLKNLSCTLLWLRLIPLQTISHISRLLKLSIVVFVQLRIGGHVWFRLQFFKHFHHFVQIIQTFYSWSLLTSISRWHMFACTVLSFLKIS